MLHIWAYIKTQLHEEVLDRWSFAAEDIRQITSLIENRRAFNVKTMTCAAYALDHRFCGSQLPADEWTDVSDLLVKMSVDEGVDRRSVVNGIMQFRSRSGVVYGRTFNWEAALTDCCIRNPRAWWQSVASTSPLSKVAVILLLMPATSAMVERRNKAYTLQKTKSRNRLTCKREATISTVAYNLKIQRKFACRSDTSPTTSRHALHPSSRHPCPGPNSVLR